MTDNNPPASGGSKPAKDISEGIQAAKLNFVGMLLAALIGLIGTLITGYFIYQATVWPGKATLTAQALAALFTPTPTPLREIGERLVLDLADHVTSTSGMLRFAKASDAEEFIVGTELGLIHRLRKESPGKVFHPLRRDMICPNMKKTTLSSVLRALREMTTVFKVPEDTRIPAKKALDRMLAIP